MPVRTDGIAHALRLIAVYMCYVTDPRDCVLLRASSFRGESVTQ